MSSTATEVLAGLTQGTWTIDPTHSTVGFVARHMMVTKVRGSFTEFSADVVVADDPLASSVTAEVQMASIDTGNEDRDNHLRTNDFFDVAQYPTMTLRSTGFAPAGKAFVMTADLTIKGVTKQVEFDVEFDGVGQDPWGGTRAGLSASTTVLRSEFGIEFNAALETGGVLVSDKVSIELDIQLVRG
ncbi:MAG TPA: YceI family protein [Ilumatobacter sp.]|nr:YceI family protein [Ilumatobacter sp.]